MENSDNVSKEIDTDLSKLYEPNQARSLPSAPSTSKSFKRSPSHDPESISPAIKRESKKSKWEPPKFKQTLNNIQKMRNDTLAPVDMMVFNDKNLDPKVCRFHCLVSLMLSPRTRDELNLTVMQRLKRRFNGFTPRDVVKCKLGELEELLKPVSFYKTKAKHIKETSQILIENYHEDIPNTVEALLELPGVGEKTAYLCMKSAWDVVSGIAVDTHMHRIINRLKWVQSPTKTAEDTRLALESWLPFEMWGDITRLLIGFGQTICAARPKCDICLNSNICPFYLKNQSKIKSEMK
uniref:Endonuclease III homolog n=1 Tax=Culicoides sonorensis TaxID=179676 RepID=A0A336LMV8_CULSO